METVSSKTCLPRDECIKDLDLFFAKGLYNSCEATDELIKSIEDSQDEALARKALVLYQRHYSTLNRPWDHVVFMYGLGMIYMHFNAYHLAIKAFRETIYVHPSFARSRDVHTRLGLIFKATGRFKLSEKHFNLAINDTRPDSGASTRYELEFNLAHLYEIQGKLEKARSAYQRLLEENDLPQQLSANIHRQLGWMCFYSDIDAESRNDGRKQNMFHSQNPLSNSRIDAALNYLNTSYRSDSDPKTSYCLGRCFTNIGKFQDAFASYRSVIDREESTADTWCSIGVLYHRQNQHTDALQAYIRSVQFDKQHTVAWMNLGILYESHHQFNDALKCYQHVLRSSSDEIDASLQVRIKYIQKQLSEIETSLNSNGKTKINPQKLLSLEELWNLESKTCSNNSSSDNIVPRAPASNSLSTNGSTHESGNLLQAAAHTDNLKIASLHSNGPTNLNHIDPSMNAARVLNNCAKEIETHKIERQTKSKHFTDANSVDPSTPTNNHIGLFNDCKLEISTHGSQDFKPQSIDSKDSCLSQVLTNGASKDSGISSNSSTYADSALVPSQNTNVLAENHISAEQVIEAYRNSHKTRKYDVNVLSDDSKPPHTFPRPPPFPPLPSDKLFPSPPSIFLETKKDLASRKIQDCCQTSPISIVRNIATVLKLDLGLFSTKTLVESNPDHPVDVTSHSIQMTEENLDVNGVNQWACDCRKSSSTISRYATYQVSSFRESLQEERESKSINPKASLAKESETDSSESLTTNSKRLNNNNQSSNQLNNELMLNNGNSRGSANKRFKRDQTKQKFVKSANSIDLSDDKKWRPQLNELNKLPNFIKCVSASNMLIHVGTSISGLNTIAMSMHVPGCRILGNKTPNNFCPVNINVGPGDYEWCAIPAEYGSILNRLCNRYGFDLGEENWWPRISEFQKYNIPIYRFSQRPGDLVWVNSGTIYWVQATGWCNNIHWNVGPLCAKQYRSASESFELNKLLFRKSDVPMIQLTWNIVININIIPDDELYSSIVDVLRRSLGYCILVKELVDQSRQSIQFTGVEPGPKVAKYCYLCESEVFNIFFVKKFDDSHLCCVECARRLDPRFDSYTIRQEYDLNYLMKLYDNFIETKKKFQSRQKQ